MFKLYVGALNGENIYKESNDKKELVEAYQTFCKSNVPAVVQLMEDDRNITEELKHDTQTQIERLD